MKFIPKLRYILIAILMLLCMVNMGYFLNILIIIFKDFNGANLPFSYHLSFESLLLSIAIICFLAYKFSSVLLDFLWKFCTFFAIFAFYGSAISLILSEFVGKFSLVIAIFIGILLFFMMKFGEISFVIPQKEKLLSYGVGSLVFSLFFIPFFMNYFELINSLIARHYEVLTGEWHLMSYFDIVTLLAKIDDYGNYTDEAFFMSVKYIMFANIFVIGSFIFYQLKFAKSFSFLVFFAIFICVSSFFKPKSVITALLVEISVLVVSFIAFKFYKLKHKI